VAQNFCRFPFVEHLIVRICLFFASRLPSWLLAADAAARRLVYDRNQVLMVGPNDWNIDMILGPPSSGFSAPLNIDPIVRATPATIRIAVEAKTIMTEHGKARRNRQRDLDSFHQFACRYDSTTISAAVTVLNVATTFQSPLRQ